MIDEMQVRHLSRETETWLRRLARQRGVSQNSLIVSLLHEARLRASGPSLFPETDAEVPAADLSASHQSPEILSPDGVPARLPFTFIDLFSGIGGLRLGLESAGGQCLFSCEKDAHARKTYTAWFGEQPTEDVVDHRSGAGVPQHDLLTAGFPCQPFSIAGVSKKKSLGRAHGFLDQTQGTLFFYLAEIIDAMKPAVLMLENVKNLRSHDKGNTWRTIAATLDELGYVLFDRTIDAADYVPQHRERIFIVGFRRDVFGSEVPFEFPQPPVGQRPQLHSILEDEQAIDSKYVLSDLLWQYLQNYAIKHKAKGNGFGFGLADRSGTTRTLSARYHKDGSEILIPRGRDQNPRRLTIVEAGRLMGFPEHLVRRQVVSDTQAYRQFGNAVVPIVASAVASQIVRVMAWHLLRRGNGRLLG